MEGLTVSIDLYQCGNLHILRDMNALYDSMERAVKAIEFTAITHPQIIKVKGDDANYDINKWGLTGILVLKESHLSYHAWPEKAYLWVIISGCRRFPIDKLKDELIRTFAPKEYELKHMISGQKVD